MIGASKFDPLISAIKVNLETIQGELYRFVADQKKVSASKCRKALLSISKISFAFRKELMDAVKALPKRRRNISPEQIKENTAKRKATIEAKNAKRNRK